VSDNDPVFTTPAGARIEYSNVYHRVLTSACGRTGSRLPEAQHFAEITTSLARRRT
jgi:hypothetical protein